MQPAVLAGPPAAVSGQETLLGEVGEGPANFSPSQWVHRPSLELRLPQPEWLQSAGTRKETVTMNGLIFLSPVDPGLQGV